MIQLKPAARIYFTLALASVLVVVGAVVRFQRKDASNPVGKVPHDTFAGLDLEDPECSYQAMLHAVETGGNERTRQLAVSWLDRQARRKSPLSGEQENRLLGHLRANGHSAWDAEYRFLFFNSAFNALHLGSHQEELSHLLQKLSLEAPEKTMRLYALQHIAVQRSMGHLTGPLADEIRATLHTLASQPGNPVAGTALADLVVWDGPETTPDSGLVALALKLAVDPACEVDVRVSALHTAAEASLPLARRLAADISQPVPLRKAAIARIGRHGDAADRARLEILRTENFRLAQAAEPALLVLEKRLTQPHPAEPIPF